MAVCSTLSCGDENRGIPANPEGSRPVLMTLVMTRAQAAVRKMPRCVTVKPRESRMIPIAAFSTSNRLLPDRACPFPHGRADAHPEGEADDRLQALRAAPLPTAPT